MDDLRWILAIAGAVIVVAIFISGRFKREELRRDREQSSVEPQPVNSERIEPQIKDLPHIQRASVGLSNEDDVDRSLRAPAQESPPVEGKINSEEDESDDAAESTGVAVDEDEFESFEIPAEFAKFAEERRSKQRPKFNPHDEEPVQQEMGLDVEPLVLVLAVLAKDENQFSGSEVKKALEEEDISHGGMEIFHFRMGNEKDAVFSVASVVEPGTFDLKTLSEEETPGLSLFCQLPGPVAGTVAFELLLKKARSLAEKMDGHLCDDKRNLLTEQSTAHYRDRIVSFDHEMALARKK